LFSFVLFFLAYWILLNSAFDALSILPALVLSLGTSILLYAIFSIAGWAPPLLQYFKFLKAPKISVKAPKITAPKIRVGGLFGIRKKVARVTPRRKKKYRR
jgi:hypothetical protein